MKNFGFTLAEVLITLGIIGIVAAMTLPTLIQKKTNSEVEAKLKKIYSVMNQAILMSENDNGPKEYWPSGCGYGSYPDCSEYYNKYIIPYLNKASVKGFESYGSTNIAIYFYDGTALVGKDGYHYFFFPNAKHLDTETFAQVDENGNILSRKDSGITYFAFSLYSSNTHENYKYHYKKGFEPCTFALAEFTKQYITTSSHPYACRADAPLKIWCTALIQLNGWKIPDDYPFKVRY